MSSDDGTGAFDAQPVAPIRIFMSYRRSDDRNFNGRFHDKLVALFGDVNVFLDIDSIPVASNFKQVIVQRLTEVDAVIVMIGDTWAERLGSVDDFVRMEVAEALRSGVPLIPVLIEDAPLPSRASLPEELWPMLDLNVAVVRSGADFHRDANRVIAGLHQAVSAAREASERDRQRLVREAEIEHERLALEADRVQLEERRVREAAIAAQIAASAEMEAERRKRLRELEAEERESAAEAARIEEELAANRLRSKMERLRVIEEEKAALEAEAEAARVENQRLRDDLGHVQSTPARASTADEQPSTPAQEASFTTVDKTEVGATQPPETEPLIDLVDGSRRRGRRFAAAGTVVVSALLVSLLVYNLNRNDNSGSKGPGAVVTSPSTVTNPGATTVTLASTVTSQAPTPAAVVPMRITYDINPSAVWEDGTPITAADFECTWRAQLNTPKSIYTAGNDQVASVQAGASEKQVVVDFKARYAAWKDLFSSIIKRSAVNDCNDISGDFATEMKISGREVMLQSWSPDQSVFVANPNYWGDDKLAVDRFVMVPNADTDTAIGALKAGEVDFIYPQVYPGITDQLADPNVTTVLGPGGNLEALYMNVVAGRPFADPALREAFYKSIDLDALFNQIYMPFAPGGKLLTCGPTVPGKYCPDGVFGNKYDPDAAVAIMTGAGFTKDVDGLWSKDGVAPEIKWMVNSSNTRREGAQTYLIPLLRNAGFNVVADNCNASCVFQTRLPGRDFDLAMYIIAAVPDPAYLVSYFSGERIPTVENGNTGQNFQSWNNAAATTALEASDQELDPTKRAELIKSAIVEMEKDYIMIPLYQFPTSAAYRKDKVTGVDGELSNYMAFSDFGQWQDLDGDGKIVLGAEVWPDCLNPVTECANSDWYTWTVQFPLLPSAYDTTNDGEYVATNLLAGEPKVELA